MDVRGVKSFFEDWNLYNKAVDYSSRVFVSNPNYY